VSQYLPSRMTDEDMTSIGAGNAPTAAHGEREAAALSAPRTSIRLRVPNLGTPAEHERRFNRGAVHPQPGFIPGEEENRR
jgi:hypothetical protein